MDRLELRIFLTGLKIDLSAAAFCTTIDDPVLIGKYLMAAYEHGELDDAIIHGRLGMARG